MRKLLNKDKNELLNYIKSEPEYNLFIYGDVMVYGLESETVEVFVIDDVEEYDFIILRYFSNYIIYSKKQNYQLDKAIEFLQKQNVKGISGKGVVCQKLAQHFPSFVARPTYLARLTEKTEVNHNINVVEIKAESAREIYELFCQIKEFELRNQSDPEKEIEEIRANLTQMGHAFGIYENEKLCAVAQTSAENDASAMIIGVATLPEFRGRGYATAALNATTNHCFERGLKFVCLFYDNPLAGRIYKKAGFVELGEYLVLQ